MLLLFGLLWSLTVSDVEMDVFIGMKRFASDVITLFIGRLQSQYQMIIHQQITHFWNQTFASSQRFIYNHIHMPNTLT